MEKFRPLGIFDYYETQRISLSKKKKKKNTRFYNVRLVLFIYVMTYGK